MSHLNITCDALTKTALMHYFGKSMPEKQITYDDSQNISETIIEYGSRSKTFAHPMRLGAIIDFITFAEKNDRKDVIIQIGNATLNVAHATFSIPNETLITLTEKEIAILCYLKDHQGQSVEREELLSNIWEYAKGVETHTLETHIYRLRQKIEKNPSEPLYIITTDFGYMIEKSV